MGNIALIIRAVGCHHNGEAFDIEQIGRRTVEELQAAGCTVLSAHAEGGGSTDLLSGRGGTSLRGYAPGSAEDNYALHRMTVADIAAGNVHDGWALRNPDEPARRAYERYCHASGGVSLVSGSPLPPFADLDERIKAAWRAVADPSAPRHRF